MFYFDFGGDIVVRSAFTRKKLKRYSAFSELDLAPLDARYQAETIVLERPNGTCKWIKNRWHDTKDLDEDELKQFLFQKLSTEFIR